MLLFSISWGMRGAAQAIAERSEIILVLLRMFFVLMVWLGIMML